MIGRRVSILEWNGVAIMLTLILTSIRLKSEEPHTEVNTKFTEINKPIILWDKSIHRTSIIQNSYMKKCGQYVCYITPDNNFRSHPLLKAILFYGTFLNISDLMIPRGNIHWGLLHEESPRNKVILVNEETLNRFNHSATFSRYSDSLALNIPGIEEITTNKYFLPFEKKTVLMAQEDLAPLLYIQTDKSTSNDRDDYISELMKYIRVDSYGACLNNQKLPDNLRVNYMRILFQDEFYNFAAKYKFTLAFENADCEDYITEKLWRPLIVGSVPIYYGSPSFKDWLPNKKSAIPVRDFSSPKELAEFIEKLANNQTLYNEYLDHKLGGQNSSIKNERLLDIYAKKPNGIDFLDTINEFECHICKVINTEYESKKFMVTREQFNCPAPVNALTQRPNVKNLWYGFWKESKCHSKLLNYYVSNNKTIDNLSSFYKEVSRMRLNKEC